MCVSLAKAMMIIIISFVVVVAFEVENGGNLSQSKDGKTCFGICFVEINEIRVKSVLIVKFK